MQTPSHGHVLQLDIQSKPQAWISLEHAALHAASGSWHGWTAMARWPRCAAATTSLAADSR